MEFYDSKANSLSIEQLPVWGSFTKTHYINSLLLLLSLKLLKKFRNELQNRLKKIRHLIYSERLKRLNLPTLRYRRHRGDMIEVYKILHNIYDKEVTTGILNLLSNKSTRGHSLKLTTQRSRLELRRNSFAVRVVKPWYSLSEEVVTFPSVKTGQDVE